MHQSWPDMSPKCLPTALCVAKHYLLGILEIHLLDFWDIMHCITFAWTRLTVLWKVSGWRWTICLWFESLPWGWTTVKSSSYRAVTSRLIGMMERHLLSQIRRFMWWRNRNFATCNARLGSRNLNVLWLQSNKCMRLRSPNLYGMSTYHRKPLNVCLNQKTSTLYPTAFWRCSAIF